MNALLRKSERASELSLPEMSEDRYPAPKVCQISQHASLRMAQRGIPWQVVSSLIAAGKREHDGRGGVRIHLRHKAAQRRFADLIGERVASGYRDLYAVLAKHSQQASPTLVTVGWLSGRRLKR